MRAGNPFEAVALSVGSALFHDLPDIEYEPVLRIDPKTKERVRGEVTWRRPHEHEIEVVMFPQTWGSTALGFGGMGGSAVTQAYTVTVFGPKGEVAVYFGGRFAYLIEHPNERFFADLDKRALVSVREANRKYRG